LRVYASIDLGGTNIAGALATEDGTLLLERSTPTESHLGPMGVLDRVVMLVRDMQQTTGERPVALGMGLPGLIDLRHGVTQFMPNLPTNWRNVPVSAYLHERLGCPVYLLNDARMATLGELTFGVGTSVRNMLMFTLGTGIGGGVVVNGELVLGALGAAGELGHQTIVADGPLCGCGNRGCVEALTSGPALSGEGVRLLRAGQAPKLHQLVGGDAAQVNPRTMADAARAGEKAVALAFERAARYLGIAIANLATALHPELVVLTGGVVSAADLFLEPIRDELRTRVRMFPAETIRVEPSVLQDKAGIWGGIALARKGGVTL
jgi:glucokinase